MQTQPVLFLFFKIRRRHGVDCDVDCITCGPNVRRCAYGTDKY
ncbi:hypothetical protein HMPREF3183_01075 [Peptostreptococcus anaerobius]|nr:hypothetical protein HMPREF3183_01075 [Peptostreptococcus anaerobius]